IKLLGEVLVIRELRDILAAQGIKTAAELEAAQKDPAQMQAIAANARVSEAVVSELMLALQEKSQRKSLESSGIFKPEEQPLFRVPAFLKRLFQGSAVPK